MYYTASCNTESSAPEDERDQLPKHVELIGIINKPLLLHLVVVYIKQSHTSKMESVFSGFRRDVISAPFWDFTQRKMVISYRRFGTTYRSHFQVSSSPRRIVRVRLTY